MSVSDPTQQAPEGQPEEDFLSQEERQNLKRILSKPEEFPREFGSWINDYMGTNGIFQKSQVQGLPLLNEQVQGALEEIEQLVIQLAAAQVTARADTVATSETTTGGYVDLATVGPLLNDLTAGTYMILYGATAHSSSGTARFGLFVNGSQLTELVNGVTFSTPFPLMDFIVRSFATGDDIKLMYRQADNVGTSTFSNRKLVALRIGA